jgi:predicted PurR-regulated permease PerM
MKKVAIFGGIAVVVLIAALVAVLIWVDTDFLRKLSYVSLSMMSVFACGLLIAVTALVAIIAALIQVLNNLTREKVSPLIDKVNEAADTARGTAVYVGEGIVSPMVRLASLLAAVRGAVSALFTKRS